MAGYIKSLSDSLGKTVLGDVFYAIESYNDQRAISFINYPGFDVNQINPKTGKTVLETSLEQLLYTAKNKNGYICLTIIKALLKQNVIVGKAEIDKINNNQIMILIFLIAQRDIAKRDIAQRDFFEYFLNAGADPNVIYKGDNNNNSLFLIMAERLSVLSRRDSNSFKETLDVSKIMDMVLDKGADPNVANIYGEVPLTKIIDMDYFQGNTEYRKYWIEKLVDSTQTLEQLVKPFFYLLDTHANRHNSGYYVEYFLKKGGPGLIKRCYEKHILVLTTIIKWIDTTRLTQNKDSLKIMKILIDYGANVDEMDSNGYTLLHRLLDTHKIKMAMWLLQHGADPNLIRPDGKTPIMYAVEEDNLEIVEILLGKYNLSENTLNDPDTAILSADIINKIDMSRTEKDLLWTAAEGRNNSEIVELLMEAGADQEYESSDGFSVLDIAVHYGNSLVCTALLENGFDINTKNSVDNTALHIAARNTNGNQNADVILQTLIQKGADINSRNIDGDTPLHWAANPHNKKSFNPENYKMNEQLASLLIEYEADPTIKNKKYKTALFYAKTDSMNAIINAGLDSMEHRQSYNFDLSEIMIDDNRKVFDPFDQFEGTETLLKDYLRLYPNNKVLIIGNFTLGINAEAFLEQYKDSQNRYEHKFYECKNVLSRWPKRSDIEWTTGTMFNLIKIGPYGGFIDFDIFFGILNSKDRVFELRKIKEMSAIAGLQMLHHNPRASSSEHCQGGAINDYYEVRTVEYYKRQRLSSLTKSTKPTEKTASPTSAPSKRGRTSRGGKKTRRRREKV